MLAKIAAPHASAPDACPDQHIDVPVKGAC